MNKTIIIITSILCMNVSMLKAYEIFSDNFESSNLDAWTAIQVSGSNSIAAVSDVKKLGSYAVLSQDTDASQNRAYASRCFNEKKLYFRFYVRFKDTFFSAMGSSDYRVFAAIVGDSGSLTLRAYNNRFQLIQTFSWGGNTASVTPEADRWYCIEIYAPECSASSTVRWWIDGAEQPALNNQDFSSASAWCSLLLGMSDGTNTAALIQSAYYDEAVVSTDYIGPGEESANGRLEFKDSVYKGDETCGTAVITVSRRGGSAGAVSVCYAASNGSASAGSDYTEVSGTLSWPSGDTSDKSFSVYVVNDTESERREEIKVILSSPTGGAVPGSRHHTDFLIYDDDLLGVKYYISKNGSNADGLSWATAWNELDQINWSVVYPGDTILLDGGASQMTYTTTLGIKGSGEEGRPVTIKLSNEAGRNGKAVLFGGRSEPLPYCGQQDYTYVEGGTGIDLFNAAWVVIDGAKWRGITIYGGLYSIRLSRNNLYPSDVLIRNIEAYDCGSAYWDDGFTTTGWRGDEGRISAGTSNNITFERIIVHDNGEDCFGTGPLRNFTIRQSWMYNSRVNPLDKKPFGHCTHADGMQVYSGDSSNVLVEDTIVGPGFMQGLFMQTADIQDITFRNILLFGNSGSGNFKLDNGNCITLENITSYTTSEGTNKNMECYGVNYTVRNSIFRGGQCNGFPATGGVIENNVVWGAGTWHPSWGSANIDANPQFVHDPSTWTDITADFTPQNPVCSGKGSSITSVAAFFNMFPDEGAAGSLKLNASTYGGSEASGNIVITVLRQGGTTGAVSVAYATSNGTASAGSDYTAKTGTLNWASGDSADKTFTIAVINDTGIENSETVNITLSNVSGGAVLGSPSGAVLTIADNDIISTDTTPPLQIAAVRDGAGADSKASTSTAVLSANWDASGDVESGIAKYWYAIGTTAGGTNVLNWTDNGALTYVTKIGLSLSTGVTYYFTVKAENGVGLQGEPVSSDGLFIEPPVVAGNGNNNTNIKSRLTVKHQGLCPLSTNGEVRFQLSGTVGSSELKIYTITGKLVKTLEVNSGISEIDWTLVNEQGCKIKPGIYLYAIQDSDKNRKTGKVVISR